MGQAEGAITVSKGREKVADVSINEKVEKITPGKATREHVIEAFGKPDRYIWKKETFSEEELPDRVLEGKSYIIRRC